MVRDFQKRRDSNPLQGGKQGVSRGSHPSERTETSPPDIPQLPPIPHQNSAPLSHLSQWITRQIVHLPTFFHQACAQDSMRALTQRDCSAAGCSHWITTVLAAMEHFKLLTTVQRKLHINTHTTNRCKSSCCL